MNIYQKISNWDALDPLGLIDFIEKNNVEKNRILQKWKYSREHTMYVLYFEIHTGGSDGLIITALKETEQFFSRYHTKWERPGHYYFEIRSYQIGYHLI